MITAILTKRIGRTDSRDSRRRDRRFRPAGLGLEGLEDRRVPSGFGITSGGTITNGDAYTPPPPPVMSSPFASQP